jgi:PIN domain nuclease of toxin-antitoxin system
MNQSIIVDSHVFLWLLYEPSRIGQQARQQLLAADKVYVSAASLWELTLKHLKGKLTYDPVQLQSGVSLLNCVSLAIEPSHILSLSRVNLVQSDPFDNLLVAQCLVENSVLLTADKLLLQSSYSTLDCGR